MDYLNNTLVFLEQQNKQLKQKLRRMEDLQNIINEQNKGEQKEYLTRLHLQEIKVIREMAEQKERALYRQIKQLKKEIQEITQTLLKQEDAILQLKRQLQRSESLRDELRSENVKLQSKIHQLKAEMKSLDEAHREDIQDIQVQFKSRQEEIMQNYIQKLDQLTQQHEDQLLVKQRNIDSLTKKIQVSNMQKELLQGQIQKLTSTLRDYDLKKTSRGLSQQHANSLLKKQNEQLLISLKQSKSKVIEIEEALNLQIRTNKSLQSQIINLKHNFKSFESHTRKQLQKQKSKTVSMSKNLAAHQKYLKGQQETSKRKQYEFNQSKKALLGKIKDMEYKGKSNNCSVLDKTTIKNHRPHLQSYQSVSLNTSFSKDSPVVSCFLNNEKSYSKPLQSKKPLSINTSSQQTLLRFQSLDTPCFQSTKQMTKKTIKIKK